MRRTEASPGSRSMGQGEESGSSSLTASTPLQRLGLSQTRSPPRLARLVLDLAAHFYFQAGPCLQESGPASKAGLVSCDAR